MNNVLENISEEWKVGDPAKLLCYGQYLYGRLYKNNTDSSYYDGKYARVYFITPGGTTYHTGRAFLSKLDDSEMEKLKYWERLHMTNEEYVGLYDNKMKFENGQWQEYKCTGVKTNEMEYKIIDNIVKVNIKKKCVPIEKYFGNIPYVDKLNDDALKSIIDNALKAMNNGTEYRVLDTVITDSVEITINNPGENDKIEVFITEIQRGLRRFYEKNEVHITRMFGSYILLEKKDDNLKAVQATSIPIKYCPLMKDLLTKVGGPVAEKLLGTLNVEDVKCQKEMMCKLIDEVVIKGGYFDTNRPLNSCEVDVLFGASEMMSSAFKANLIDAGVIVSNGLGTIVTTNDSNTQGAVKRMTGLFDTSPSEQLMKTAREANIVPVFPYTATIDQIAGVKKAIELGYKRIAVSVASSDNYLHRKLKELETQHNVTIYRFGLCTTGIDNETAHIMSEDADIIWSCASKAVREYVEPKAIAQVGVKIPVHIMTRRVWPLVRNHLTYLNNKVNFDSVELTDGDNKPLFINDKEGIKVLVKKQVHNCTDCPHPCV